MFHVANFDIFEVLLYKIFNKKRKSLLDIYYSHVDFYLYHLISNSLWRKVIKSKFVLTFIFDPNLVIVTVLLTLIETLTEF